MTYTIDTSRRSPNYDRRTRPIGALLIHSDEGTEAGSLGWLCSPSSGVSSGYYVSRAGHIYELVEDHNRAWHAGVCNYGGITDWNSASIGIECEHKRGQDWPQVQLDALAWLCRQKIQAYNIRRDLVALHRWVAVPVGRKQDPTDWSDSDFRAWVGTLYASADPFAAWGPLGKPTGAAQGYAIPQTWLANQWLGPCRMPEDYTKGGAVAVAMFQNGVVIYDTATNQARAARF